MCLADKHSLVKHTYKKKKKKKEKSIPTIRSQIDPTENYTVCEKNIDFLSQHMYG